ncbi:2-oxoglutarate (2OG) and Fe(II)-dependent oxygenase superfamily protein [Euphorbia peplus]|nr:2-oxoglutarate (2OG) and Fe(II)-dependent oxygenase superfamily protein [Euphorbia peplus]
MKFDPPFEEYRKKLLKNSDSKTKNDDEKVEECELPLIDMKSLLGRDEDHYDNCMKAASEWGFFQLKNHGIPQHILEAMQSQQKNVFYEPFFTKSQAGFLNLSPNSYRWGNPKATCLYQLSRSEAFHISFSDISKMHHRDNLRSTIQAFGEKAGALAEQLAEILGKNMGISSNFFEENCSPTDSYIRMNRYPKQNSPLSSQIHGLLPHTDSCFLTILYQDQTGGLQLKKDGKWRSVRPNPNVVIVNTGDLFQAMSNDVYKSVQHRVVVPKDVDRFSVAYFYCPCSDAVIESCGEPRLYRKFSFREYKQKIQDDVQATGNKVGLSRFLL